MTKLVFGVSFISFNFVRSIYWNLFKQLNQLVLLYGFFLCTRIVLLCTDTHLGLLNPVNSD